MSDLNGMFPIGVSSIQVLGFRNPSLHFICRDCVLRSFFLVLKNRTNGTTVQLTHKKWATVKTTLKFYSYQIISSPTDQKTTEQKGHLCITAPLGSPYLLTNGNAATSLE